MSSKKKKTSKVKFRKPSNKHTLTFHFDTKCGRENFMAQYLNSCEQHIEYYSQGWGRDWIYVKPPSTACPKCEYNDWGDYYDYDNTAAKLLKVQCRNCEYFYHISNPIPAVYRRTKRI